MPFFDNDTATTVQLISAPLEFVGLTLTLIEVKFPELARRIENSIFRCSRKINVYTYRIFHKQLNKTHFNISKHLLTIYLILYFAYFFAFQPSVDNRLIIASVWLLYFLTRAASNLESLNDFIIVLRDFSNGRALGALGVLLATLGFFGELYQVCVIFLGD